MISTHIIGAAHNLRNTALSLMEEQIKKSPSVSFGRHYKNGKPVEVIRFRTTRNGKLTWCELSLSSKTGKKCIPVARKIAMLRKALLELKKEAVVCRSGAPVGPGLSSSSQEMGIIPENTNRAQKFSYEEWCALVENNDQSIKNGCAAFGIPRLGVQVRAAYDDQWQGALAGFCGILSGDKSLLSY